MKQGVLRPGRASLLLSKGHSCYRSRRTGERKRKTVRGCIVGSDIAALSLVLVKQGEKDIPGLTDTNVPKRLGPKRASKIRKLFVCGFFVLLVFHFSFFTLPYLTHSLYLSISFFLFCFLSFSFCALLHSFFLEKLYSNMVKHHI
jgi:hypothetical protein